ncbi:MAG: DNA repair protein RecO, partial [Gammaproteobacteria bacterium]
MRPVNLEPGYVLHTRRYRETSLLLEAFTLDHGRVGLIARGANRPKSRLGGILSPFQPLALSWSGRGELKTLVRAELTAPAPMLIGERLMSAFYVNELIMSFLHRTDAHRDLFAHYSNLVTDLRTDQELQPLLRQFELLLLAEVGYGLNLDHDAESGEALEPDSHYRYDAEIG